MGTGRAEEGGKKILTLAGLMPLSFILDCLLVLEPKSDAGRSIIATNPYWIVSLNQNVQV